MGRGCPDTRPGYHPQVQCGSGAVGNGCFHPGGYGQGADLPVVSMGFRATTSSKNVVQPFRTNATYRTLCLT